jgi:hypothetical protein
MLIPSLQSVPQITSAIGAHSKLLDITCLIVAIIVRYLRIDLSMNHVKVVNRLVD